MKCPELAVGDSYKLVSVPELGSRPSIYLEKETPHGVALMLFDRGIVPKDPTRSVPQEIVSRYLLQLHHELRVVSDRYRDLSGNEILMRAAAMSQNQGRDAKAWVRELSDEVIGQYVAWSVLHHVAQTALMYVNSHGMNGSTKDFYIRLSAISDGAAKKFERPARVAAFTPQMLLDEKPVDLERAVAEQMRVFRV